VVVAVRLMPPLSRRRSRRREYKVLLAVLGAAVLLILFAGQALGGSGSQGTNVVVQPGQSLWGIAADHPAGGDIRARVDELISVNHLASASSLAAGQTLFIPAN
jgi:LysM domain